jgi:hypothetical protein
VAAGGSGGPTIVVTGDAVLASSLSSYGPTTIKATRPDALTGKPVVIGAYSGTGNPLTPFSVNTTTPTPLNASGDCWQKGALSRGLTPDLQPGDTVSLTQSGFFGGSSTTTSVVVPPDGSKGVAGPISGCSSTAPWARDAITTAPSSVTDGPITVSGVAQPLATGVAVSASDGTHVSAPASVTPAADGSWSATIPVEHLARLANAPLTVTPVFAVPDVSTGAPAHIVGVAASVKKAVPAPDTSQRPAPTDGHAQEPSPTGKPTGGHHPRPTRKPRVTGLRSASSLTLAAVRSHGLTASFLVPAGTKTVEVELLHGSKPTYQTILRADKAGSQQTVWLGDSRLYRLLRRGHYTIAVRAGTSRSTLGAATTRGLTIR